MTVNRYIDGLESPITSMYLFSCNESDWFISLVINYFIGDIEIHIDGPTKTDYKRSDHGDRCDVTFMPMTPGAYNITIKYKNKEIKGSPFVSKVSG